MLIYSLADRYQNRSAGGVPFQGLESKMPGRETLLLSSLLQAVCWCFLSQMGVAHTQTGEKSLKKENFSLSPNLYPCSSQQWGSKELLSQACPSESLHSLSNIGYLVYLPPNHATLWWDDLVLLRSQSSPTASLLTPHPLLSEPLACTVQWLTCMGNDLKNIIKTFLGAVESSKENSWEAGNMVGGKM